MTGEYFVDALADFYQLFGFNGDIAPVSSYTAGGLMKQEPGVWQGRSTSANGFGSQGCHLICTTPGEGVTRTAMAVIMDYRAATGAIFKFHPDFLPGRPESDQALQDFLALQSRIQLFGFSQNLFCCGGVLIGVIHVYFVGSTEYIIIFSRKDVTECEWTGLVK